MDFILPTVVNSRKSRYDVYIGRGSIWGNPFRIGEHGNREEVIEKYREWILTQPTLLDKLWTLEGKVLGCFCAPLRCHGDVLVALCNDRFNAPLPDSVVEMKHEHQVD